MSIYSNSYAVRKDNLANPEKLPEKVDYLESVVQYIPDKEGMYKGTVYAGGMKIYESKEPFLNAVINNCKYFVQRCYDVKINYKTIE